MVIKKNNRRTNRKQQRTGISALIKRGENGDLDAQYLLGAMYAMGDLVIQDESQAVEWYTKAAEGGHAEAQFNLGTMIIQGEGIEKDLEKGIGWMEQAVANGYEYSAHVLAMIYRSGMYGIKPDPVKATYWDNKAGSYKDKS
jgi:TPR repeat protein